MKFLLLLCSLGLAPRAQASEILAYSWPLDQELHYRIQAYINAPRALHFWASQNLDARVIELTMAMEVNCQAQEPSRRSQEWECTVRRVELGGLAFEGEQEDLNTIFMEYASLLRESLIQVQFTRQGRIKLVDLENIPKDTEREKLMHEYLRLLIQRAFAALELELPRGGESDAGAWRQRGSPMTMRLPTRYGTAGGIHLEHEVVGTQDGLVEIHSLGRGIVTPGSALESGSDQAVNLNVTGTALFNVEDGVLQRYEVQTIGALTTSSSLAGSGFYINQLLLVERVLDWETDEVAEEVAEFGPGTGDSEEEAAEEETAEEETAEEEAAVDQPPVESAE